MQLLIETDVQFETVCTFQQSERLRLNTIKCQLNTSYPEVASTGEVLAVLVEGHGHDAVSRVEGLLNAVAVVNVNVDVQHALVISEQTIGSSSSKRYPTL